MKTLILAMILFLGVQAEGKGEELKVVTTEFPPYQILDGDEVRGISTEIVKGVLEIAGIKARFYGYPWARAYRIAQKEPNVLIYSLARTAEREKLFKWVGTIVPYNVYFWKLRDRHDIKANTIEEAKRYNTGGTIDDIKSIELIKLGFVSGKNLELVSSDEISIRKLFAGRIEIMPYDEMSFLERIKRAGFSFDKVEKMGRVDSISHELYIGVSLKTSDETVKKLKNALVQFKKTKRYRELQNEIYRR